MYQALATPWFFGYHVSPFFPPVQRSVYYPDLQRWFDHFPAHNIHIVDGERLISDPYTEMRALETFLGVKQFYKPSHFSKSEDKGFPCKQSKSGTKQCLNDGKGHKYESLQKRTNERLKEYFEPYNEMVYSLVGRDFGWKDIKMGD